MQAEAAKLKKYEVENIRRQHNYIPFIMELFRLTAKKGHLSGLIEKAKVLRIEKNKKAEVRKVAKEAAEKERAEKKKKKEEEEKEEMEEEPAV